MKDDSRYEDLTRMFTLLSKVDELLTLKAFFGVYIKKKGADLVIIIIISILGFEYFSHQFSIRSLQEVKEIKLLSKI